MAEANGREEVEEDAVETEFRLRLLREEQARIERRIAWEVWAFTVRNPGCVIE